MIPSPRFCPESYSGMATQDAISFCHAADDTSFLDSFGFSPLPSYLQDSAASPAENLDACLQIPDLDVARCLSVSIPVSDAVLSVVPDFRQGPVIWQRPRSYTRTPDDDYSDKTQSHLINKSQSSYWSIEDSLAAVDPTLLQRAFHHSVPTSTEIPYLSSWSSSLIEKSTPKPFGTSPNDDFFKTAPSPHRFSRGRDKQVIARRRQRPAREFCRVCDGLDFTAKRSLENHILAEHLGMRFRCPVEGCMNDYRHMTSLGRHIRVDHRGIMERYMGSVGGD